MTPNRKKSTSMDYYKAIKPILFHLKPETAHNLAITAIKHNLLPTSPVIKHPALETNIAGMKVRNPVGLAAGFDKNAECIPTLLKQGFGGIEVGTITPKPQSGNPKPRLFRLEEDNAIINRMGFNNKGAEYALKHIKKSYKNKPPQSLLGINIGKNKTTENALEDYLPLLNAVSPYADYITINISSPNTPGLRKLQNRNKLDSFLATIQQEDRSKNTPIFVKIAPDLDDQQLTDIVELAISHQIDGLIISNTTLERPNLKSKYAKESGGLSGAPLYKKSTEILEKTNQIANKKLCLIAAGGITSAEDAYEKLKAGASFIQIYSALIYHGFPLIQTINKGILDLLKRDKITSIQELQHQ